MYPVEKKFYLYYNFIKKKFSNLKYLLLNKSAIALMVVFTIGEFCFFNSLMTYINIINEY
jgi:hypothetical protein